MSAEGTAEAPNVVEPEIPRVPEIHNEPTPSVVNEEFLITLPVVSLNRATAYCVEDPGPVTSPPPPAAEIVTAPLEAEAIVIPDPATKADVPSTNFV
jgi:hypothetical protein